MPSLREGRKRQNVGYPPNPAKLAAAARQPNREGPAAVTPDEVHETRAFHAIGMKSHRPSHLLRTATTVALASALSCAGCAVRYDATGVSRVGIGLWGFGDPPGVNWNLDSPRRDVPELPTSPRPEPPPRRDAPQWQSRDMSLPDGPKREYRSAKCEGTPVSTPLACPDEPCGLEFPIGDNRGCASRCFPEIACPMAVRVRDRSLVAARG